MSANFSTAKIPGEKRRHCRIFESPWDVTESVKTKNTLGNISLKRSWNSHMQE